MKENIHGFIVEGTKEIPSQKSTATLYTHEKTGAQVLKIATDDTNKAFGIGFRTPPKDSTGVAHILEHCVLGGSEKYTTKEPFMDLVGGSLQTFLNAMTFSDKTIYPIASRNTEDYHNLMDVYLDAVFRPLVLTKEAIFNQEGIVEVLEDDGLKYNGVVYNEMKGAMSVAEDQVMQQISEYLLPDTIYANNSGGDPYAIPDLTYENFIDFYKKYYHPSNSYIYFYGDEDIEKELEHVAKYLDTFEKADIDSAISYQQPFDAPKRVEGEYHVGLSDDVENKDYLGIAIASGVATDAKERMMISLLNRMLLSSEASPLKRALLDAGIGEDFMSPNDDGYHINFGIIAKNTSKDRMDEFVDIFNRIMEKIAKEGAPKDLLEASFNKMEFHMMEGPSYSYKGVVKYITALSDWLYDQNPLESIDLMETLQELRKEIEKGGLQTFIQEKIIDNPHRLEIVVTPKPGLFDEKDKGVEEKLKKQFASLTEEEKVSLSAKKEKLDEYQSGVDTKEDKMTIPRLSLKNLDPHVDRIDQHVYEDKVRIAHNDVNTDGIVYLDMIFDLSHLTQEELAEASHVVSFLKDVTTEKRGYEELATEIDKTLGGFNIQLLVSEENKTKRPLPNLLVSAKFFPDKQAKAVDIIREVLYTSTFDDDKRLKEILSEDLSSMDADLIQSGHAIAMKRVRAYVNQAAALTETTSGLDSYFNLQETVAKFDDEKKKRIARWKEIYAKLFRKEKCIVGVTTTKELFEQTKDNWAPLYENLPSHPEEVLEVTLPEMTKEGFISQATVQYVSKGADIEALGYEYSGDMAVLTNMVSTGFLHNQIRAKGGAYGSGLSITQQGLLSTYSYRDPKLTETIGVYKNMGSFMEEFDLSQDDLELAIIGTINAFDPPMSPRDKGIAALYHLVRGTNYDMIEERLKEAIGTTVEGLKKHHEMLTKAMEEEYLCVLGSEKALTENEELFDRVVKLDYKARTQS